MLYISKIDNSSAETKFGITDTDDNVTEFCTKAQIKDILLIIGYTSIKGVVYTGSDLKIRVTTPLFEYINDLTNGSTFTLAFADGSRHFYKRLSELTGAIGWAVVKDNKEQCKLTKKYLLETKAVLVG